MAENYLYAASAEMPGGKGPFVPKEHSPEPVIGLFLTFLSSVKPRGWFDMEWVHAFSPYVSPEKNMKQIGIDSY